MTASMPAPTAAPHRTRTLILGLGETGVAAARWCLRRGERLRIVDTRTQPPGMAALHEHPTDTCDDHAPVTWHLGSALDTTLLADVSRIVLSPGLAPKQAPVAEFLAAARERDIAVINEVELFALALAELHAERAYAPRVLAVTGTNGKTTVTALTRHLLAAGGLTVRAVGNIAPAATAGLLEALEHDDLPAVWVLELSSFQLEYLSTLKPDAAVVLNLSQDHLDWHGDMAAYAAAKARLLALTRAHGGVCLVNRDDAVVTAMLTTLEVKSEDVAVHSFGSNAPPLVGDVGLADNHGVLWLAAGADHELDSPAVRPANPTPISATDAKPRRRKTAAAPPLRQPARVVRMMPADALRLRGLHNALNAQAALLLARSLALPWHALLPALRDYAGEPHRMAFVRCIGGVDFINDSKGTNVGATVAALAGAGSAGRVILIAGGLGKGQDFSPLAAAVAQYARAVVLIGQDAEVIAQALSHGGVSCERAESLAAALTHAWAVAEPGDTVLLSPACASMDMFRHYAHRGEAFVEAVHALALAQGEVA